MLEKSGREQSAERLGPDSEILYTMQKREQYNQALEVMKGVQADGVIEDTGITTNFANNQWQCENRLEEEGKHEDL